MNRKYSYGLLLLIILVLLVWVSGAVLAANGFEITRWVIAGGGGPAEGGDYVLNAAVGQPVVGNSANAPYERCAGFWCGIESMDEGQYIVSLPLIVMGD